MHPFPHRFGLSWLCLLMAGCVAAAIQPAFCESSPSANPSTQTAAVDPSSPEATGTDHAPPPRFQGTELPVPPQQGQPWTPPATALPHEVVDAIKAVFDEGLADPRGCDYREITVAVGNCWQGDAGVNVTHNWVIHGQEKFAVCWNGLVYPVVSTGAAADLHADAQSLLLADPQALQEKGSTNRREDTSDRSWFSAEPCGSVTEKLAVSWQSMLPFKAVLLLRLGEGDLAARLWSRWFDVKSTQPAEMGSEVYVPSATKLIADGHLDPSAPNDPYLWIARSWVWAEFDRALTAHMRGDDHLALASARALLPVQPVVEAEAAWRRFAPQGNETQDDAPKLRLEFLGQLPDLLADTERRLAEAPCTPVLDMANPPQGPERIAGLIRDLELVSARQWGQPGGVSLGGSPRTFRPFGQVARCFVRSHEPVVRKAVRTRGCRRSG